MQKYRGYYIDHVIFNSKAEIDARIEKDAVERFKKLNKYFSEHPTMEASNACMEQARYLNKEFGYSWSRIEEIEISCIA